MSSHTVSGHFFATESAFVWRGLPSLNLKEEVYGTTMSVYLALNLNLCGFNSPPLEAKAG